ncbi:DNA sulfur modification protein DndD [Flavobacterium pectinovorum]|uniref:DNA sulfur modification protein DndD n=1 Tax=Flavobacterium pectinovorum TaxID=29533 RepID=UPI001FAE55A1|nr:DNA sulfur modification protein DndD [Flavobacterium pectinovorum]MCI9843620.1 DNA sulfur modification protein DndD [Flavobacterium pectinovorum]
MKINKIKFQNFRIYKGENEILLTPNSSKNISIIAGKNGFGKTTFLTSLIWVFYGKMMSEVEEKYKKDIKNSGGYDKFIRTLLNRAVKTDYENNEKTSPVFSVEIELKDILIPFIPCKSVVIKRSYDFKSDSEELKIFIDGLENELTKEVGYEVFINDFILPREIAKFFFFDAEKIVSLAEAKSKSELKNLSKAYSEVLGIKKYEDLKKNLETLLTKLRRDGASPAQQTKLFELTDTESELIKLIDFNQDKQANIDREISSYKITSDSIQEKLIREGNGVTLEELQKMKSERNILKEESTEIKNKLKKLMDIAPLVIAGKKLVQLKEQLISEQNANNTSLDKVTLVKELNSFTATLLKKLETLNLDIKAKSSVEDIIKKTISEKESLKSHDTSDIILLDYTTEQFRSFDAVFNNIKGTFSSQFNSVVQEEKNNRILLFKVYNQIKQAEARKDNPLAKKLREEKTETENRITILTLDKGKLIEEYDSLNSRLASTRKVLSEYEKNFKLAETDQKKFVVTEKLLIKINEIIKKIKEDKKYSLQKSIMLGLRKIMHKNDFIYNVRVNVVDDVMDIDLLDKNDDVIDKDSLSKGEQQLYATALLKALVDESGIKFPVFIDSPLQKFDKYHSKNIIKEFYPAISEQVVLFPLLEKELSELEYDYLKPNVNKVFVIENNNNGSSFKPYPVDQLFTHLKQEQDVYAN